MTEVSVDETQLWPQPEPDPDSRGFWDAARAGRLALARCTSCRAWMQPPTERCRHCAGPVEFESITGNGLLHSWIVVNRKSVPGPQVPYRIGVIELAEQPGLRLSGILECEDAASLCIDMPARVELRAVPGGDFVAPVICV